MKNNSFSVFTSSKKGKFDFKSHHYKVFGSRYWIIRLLRYLNVNSIRNKIEIPSKENTRKTDIFFEILGQ